VWLVWWALLKLVLVPFLRAFLVQHLSDPAPSWLQRRA
jgi:hypothetical protein